MDISLRRRLDENRGDLAKQCQIAGISEGGIKDFILQEMLVTIEEHDWEAGLILLGMTYAIVSEQVKADVLNNLLVMPGHSLHQAVTMEIQQLGDPSSIPYIVRMLQSDFTFLKYTCSEHETIAKWFSHALAAINTSESISVIREFSASSNDGIAREMKYRLGRLDS